MTYANNLKWSDQYIPAIKRIIGPCLLDTAPDQNDCNEAADLMILHARDKRIAARVRRYGYADKYPYDFTIRSRLPSGVKTEFAKIVDGFGDWLFYGHAAKSGLEISRYMIIDLDAWRAALIRGKAPYQEEANPDGTRFISVDVRALPESVIVECSFNI